MRRAAAPSDTPRPVPPNDEPIVVEVDPVLSRLIPGFLGNRRRDLASINQELERAGFSAIEKMGHNLKGIGRSYGFDGISVIGRALELAAQGHDVSEIRRCATELGRYLERVRIAPT